MASTFLIKSRHGSVFYFRRKVPLDLRGLFPGPLFRISLETTERARAIITARKLAAQFDELFAFIRTMTDKEEFLKTPLGRLIEKRKTESPLKERIEELEVALLEVRLSGSRALAHQQVLHREQTSDLIRAIAGQAVPGPLVTPPSVVEPDSAESITLEEAITLLLSSSMKPKTRSRYAGSLEHFSAFVGTKTRVHTITQERFGEFAKHVNAHPDWSDATKSLNVTVAGRLFSWGSAGNIKNMPAITTRTHKKARTKPAAFDRSHFTNRQLKAIFDEVALHKESDPHRFWITTCCALMGCQLEEIAQAYVVGDFRQDDQGT